jgi:hypothetical protein
MEAGLHGTLFLLKSMLLMQLLYHIFLENIFKKKLVNVEINKKIYQQGHFDHTQSHHHENRLFPKQFFWGLGGYL